MALEAGMTDVDLFLLSISGLFIAGIIAELLFVRTKVPDALWLVAIGILMGPVSGFVNDRWLKWVLPFFAPFALIVILFDGGTKISLQSLKSTLGRSSLLAVVTFLTASTGLALVSWLGVMFGLFEDWNWIKAAMFGCILGGSSSIVIMPTLRLAGVKDNVANLASLESAVTDALCVVATSVLLGLAVRYGGAPLSAATIGADLVSVIGLGLIYGVIGGLLWLFVLPFLGRSYGYTITLAALLAFYVYVQNFGGSAALAILIFSIIVGNSEGISNFLRLGGERRLSDDVDFIHTQLSFVVKVFFFTLVGLMLRPPWGPVAFGLVTLVVIVLTRYPAVSLALRGFKIEPADKKLIGSCIPRGLAAGVLATLPFQYGISGTEHLRTIVFATVLFSILYYAGAFGWIQRRAGPSSGPGGGESYESHSVRIEVHQESIEIKKEF